MLSCFCSRTLSHGLPDVGVVTPASCHLPSQLVGQHQIMGTTPSRSGVEGFQVPAGNAGVSSHPEAVCVCVFSLAPAPGLLSHRLMLMSLVLTQALLKLPLASETRAPGLRSEALSTCGRLLCSWGRWTDILSHGRYKRPLSEQDVETICRTILVYCLNHYRGDENIKSFIWDLITPTADGQTRALVNHSGGSAPHAWDPGSLWGAREEPQTLRDPDIVTGVVDSIYCYHHDYSGFRFVSPGAQGEEGQEGESPELTPSGAGCRLAGWLQPGCLVPGGQLQETPAAPLQQVRQGGRVQRAGSPSGC